jgi:hypothetical protein
MIVLTDDVDHIGPLEGVRGKPARGTRCASQGGWFVSVRWAEATGMLCPGFIAQNEDLGSGRR